MKNKVYVVLMAFQVFALYEPASYCQDMELSKIDVADSEQKYQKALGLYKQNKPNAALTILDKLHRANPNDARYLYDYVAIASWSGRHDLAVAAKGLNLDVAPAYVLEALAASQREVKAYEASLSTYDLIVRRFPERAEPQVAIANTLIDAQRYSEAETQLSILRGKYPDRMDVKEAALRLSDSGGRPIDTVSEAEKILQINPNNTYALRMRFYALKKLGAVHLAARLTPATVLTESERIDAERDRLAFELRWARISADRPERGSRWKEMDAVIKKLGDLCGLAEREGDPSDVARGACGDLVVALSERRRTQDAIALYEHMVTKQWEIQPYVQVSAAQAYLDDRQPEKAQALFESALLKDPNNFNGRIGYIYALLEGERYKDADNQIDQLTSATNEWVNPQFPAIREPNPDYTQAQLTGAQVLSLTNRLSDAENRLQLLASRAPNNTEIRQALASTYNLRGWPRQAENELAWLNAAQLANVWTNLGLFENQMEIGDFQSAEQHLDDAAQLMPEERALQKAEREWETHNLRELVVESKIGNSTDVSVTPNGSREDIIDAHLYSSPIKYKWRAFLHSQYARSTFPGLSVSRDTLGAGVEYRVRDFTATTEVRNVGNTGAGIALGGDYHIDDHWFINALAENKSLAAPIRAYADNVTARNYQFGGGYRWHESRDISVTAGQMDFSDGNQRDSVEASWMEGILASARYKLESTVEYSSSHNSLQDTSIDYYNPIRDRQTAITLRNEWLQFHRYEKSLKHVLAIGIGTYAEENFSSGRIANLKYEQYYSPNDRLELRYGVGRSLHPYDGTQVGENAITFVADWKF